MICPKCKKNIPESSSVCPHCHKVLTLICPNCHSDSESSVCTKCGYIILQKCAKCGRLTPTTKENCKCGFPVRQSIAYQECESDEFASLIIKFSALRNIRNLLSSQELYTKFLIKLRNLIISQLKNIDGNIILYDNDYVVNFNKELSFATSVNKALRLALKLTNSFTGLNLRIFEELGTPLKLSIVIVKKNAEELLIYKNPENNVKLLTVKKDEPKYLKGMQIILDQYSQECIQKDYKTDSLYSMEQDGTTVMYYEVLLQKYILPPNELTDTSVQVEKNDIKQPKNEETTQDDIYSFKVFDISAKCNFVKTNSNDIIKKLNPDEKIISIRGDHSLSVKTSDIINFYEKQGKRVIYANCTPDLQYKAWGVLTDLFKDFYGLPLCSGLIPQNFDIKRFQNIKDLIVGQTKKSTSYEDARYLYMEDFVSFLRSLKDTVIIIDGFENIDDTTLATLQIYFDKFQKVNTNFVFITDDENSVHSKIKGLLRTNLYTEYLLQKTNISLLLSEIKEDASDFIQSFYYEKIKENFAGSKLYFENAIKYLIDKGVLISFENKLIIKNNNSFLLPKDLKSLIRTRLKELGRYQDASMILAYSLFLGARTDYKTCELLGIKDISKSFKILEEYGFGKVRNDVFYIDNYNVIKPSLETSLKKEVKEFIAKTILAKLGKFVGSFDLLSLLSALNMHKDEYIVMWKNSQLSILSGDYDAYLKNCLGFLSLSENLKTIIPPEEIENSKKEVFNNILISLYSYSPAKIYSIENILLMDAIKENDDEKIIKLSNLMLQGSLISSNYTNAIVLLHNILERIPNSSLIVNGAINSKILLLSLVHLEILFNTGEYNECIHLGNELLNIIRPEIIEKIKPVNFSVNSFVEHMLDTFRLVGFAKLISGTNDLDEFFEQIKTALNTELPEKDCIIAIKDFMSGKPFVPSNSEEATPFEKIIYLILQEASELKEDYKKFAQNIYQAKLLAADIHQAQLEYLCDILIAHSYAKLGILKKAHYILNDVFEKSENSAIFNINMFARYFIAKMYSSDNDYNESLLYINDALAILQKQNNQSLIFYIMFQQLFTDILKVSQNSLFDINNEEMKLLNIPNKEQYKRIIKISEKENQNNDMPEFTEATE